MKGQIAWAIKQTRKELEECPQDELEESFQLAEKLAEAIQGELIERSSPANVHRPKPKPRKKKKGKRKPRDYAPKELANKRRSDVEITEGEDEDLPF